MTTVVEIVSERTVIVDGTPRIELVATSTEAAPITVAPVGPQGPPGPAGPAGGDTFVYDRAGVPAATWTIEHDLGRRVHVTICNDDGDEVEADVQNPDLDTTVITFATPFSGTALIG